MKIQSTINILIFLITISFILSEPIDISDYDYPRKNESSDEDYIVPIFGTNDVHGYVFPMRYPTADLEGYYTGGGVEYIYSYLKILRKEWDNETLWLDGGDQFQGGYEFMLSNGSIMNKFYNFAGVDGMAIGNHEFDFTENFLKKNMNESEFTYLGANLIKSSCPEKREIVDFPNLKPSQVYQIGKVKIGVIGLGTKETPTTTSIPPKEIIFDDYVYHTVQQAKYLREKENVDAVILLAHFGPQCIDKEDEDAKYVSKIRTKEDKQTETCTESLEIMKFLEDLPEGTVDAIVAAHVHDVVHHWIKGIPIIETNGAFHAHIMYLHFKKEGEKYVLQKDKTQIEGPLPLCEKIFTDNKRCNYREPSKAKNLTMSEYSFHGTVIEKDQKLAEKLEEWKKIIDDKYNNIIVEKNEEDLSGCPNGEYECPLVNLVNDITSKTTGADISFINLGGLRTNWRPGKLSEVDIFLMFPFNNTMITYEMNGREVMRLFDDVENGYSLYPNSGVVSLFSKSEKGFIRLLNFKMFDGLKEREIDLNKENYVIGMTDFLANGGSRFSRVMEWYKPKNRKEHGNFRDIITNYLKYMKLIKKGSLKDKEHPRVRYINKYHNDNDDE